MNTGKTPIPQPIKLLGVLVLLFAGFVVGFYYGANGGAAPLLQQTTTSSTSADFGLLERVWGILEDRYLGKPLDRSAAVYGAIRGMLASLDDPYTVFLSPDEAQEFEQEIQGTFEGIGAEIGIKRGSLVIIAPLADSPAERAGLKAGDRILAIDDRESSSLSLDEAVRQIRGKKGSTVALVVQRENEEPREVSIVRESITVKSVRTRFLGNNLALIELTYFGPSTSADFRSAAQEVLVQGSRGVILDLRSNPGGYLDAAVGVASLFVPNGSTIVIEEAADGSRTELKASNGETLKDVPLVILVDQGSASGSEIVAGALQDYGVASLVGAKTFGKGSVQQIEELPDGSNLKVTVARWLTPKGRSIHDQGIDPDIAVELTEEDYAAGRDPQFDRAIATLLETLGATPSVNE